MAAGPAQAAPSTQLEFLGQQIFPTATQFRGTTFGGLSSITYDAQRNLFYAISDDQVNARFYTLRIGVAGGAPAVQIVSVTTLRDGAGQPFAPASLDPEGLTLTDDRTLVVTSEGFANRLIDPWVREFDLDGHQLRALSVPSAFLPNAAGTHGVRLNLGFESAASHTERQLPLRRRRGGARPGRPARDGRAPAAPRGSSATTSREAASSRAWSTGSSSTGRIRSPSRPCPRISSPSTASSSCCR